MSGTATEDMHRFLSVLTEFKRHFNRSSRPKMNEYSDIGDLNVINRFTTINYTYLLVYTSIKTIITSPLV